MGASLRLRYETKDSFKFGAEEPGNDEDYGLSRLRINAGLHVGREIDLTVRYGFSIGRVSTSLEVGYSHFFTGAYVRDTGPSADADFAYFQTKLEY